MATKTEKNVQLKINKMTKNIFDQLSVQGLISEDELYLLPEDEETGSATWGTIGGELSNQTDLKVMLDSKADKSKIPTVNNPTITFTQGNAVKGSITLNQANDQTISLDAGGGGGGGDIPADLSCNHLSVGTGIVVGQPNTAPNKGKGALVVNTAFRGTNTYSAYSTGIAIGSRAVANHNYSIAIGCAADATAQTTAQNQLAICAGVNGNAYDTADHILLGGNQRDPKSLTQYIREIAAASLANTEDFKFAPFDPSTGHRQEGNYINIGNSYSYYDKGIICFIVKFGETYPINLEWQDPVTYNTVQEEARISNNDSTTTEVAQLFVVPCTFGYGVNISNSYGSQMKVDELFKIEIQNAYSI